MNAKRLQKTEMVLHKAIKNLITGEVQYDSLHKQAECKVRIHTHVCVCVCVRKSFIHPLDRSYRNIGSLNYNRWWHLHIVQHSKRRSLAGLDEETMLDVFTIMVLLFKEMCVHVKFVSGFGIVYRKNWIVSHFRVFYGLLDHISMYVYSERKEGNLKLHNNV